MKIIKNKKLLKIVYTPIKFPKIAINYFYKNFKINSIFQQLFKRKNKYKNSSQKRQKIYKTMAKVDQYNILKCITIFT